MAYTLFPKNKSEIIKNCFTQPKRAADIITLFTYLRKKYSGVLTPINIDVKVLGKVNVSRELQGLVEIKDIIRDTSISEINIKFGSGSSGNRGVKNRGLAFEASFATGVQNFWNGENSSNDSSLNKAITQLAELENFKSLKELTVLEEGANNTKRPLKFQPGPIITSPTGSLDIGPAVTDLTLYEVGDKTKVAPNKVVSYLSLKFESTTTFFNIGVKTILTKKEIQEGAIKNKDGIKLLDMFGISNEMFCKVFNGDYITTNNKENTFNKINKQYLSKFLQSGIGYGYTIVHKINASKTLVFKLDKSYMKLASTPQSCTVFYAGKTGKGKRVDIEVQTPKYMLKINIRDSQGTDGYPTRIMGDFTYR